MLREQNEETCLETGSGSQSADTVTAAPVSSRAAKGHSLVRQEHCIDDT